MDKYRDTLSVISNMAKVKLAMNAHKGNIEDCTNEQLIDMLKSEVAELDEAISDVQFDDKSEKMMHVIEEAADIMNFLLAIVHKRIETYRSRK